MKDTISIDSLSAGVSENSIEYINVIAQLPEKTAYEQIYAAATVLIALANVGLLIYIFVKSSSKEDRKNERDRKIGLLKTLVLDYNMDKFYDFFDQVCKTSKQLQAKDHNVEEKTKINEEIKDFSSQFRQYFIDVFIAIDKDLYDEILGNVDALIDGITDTMFDEGINLSHLPKFEELVTVKIRSTKAEIIRILFSYKGE